MKAILNHKIIEIDAMHLSSQNRAFRYGDGLFETVAIIKGKPRFVSHHIDRLQKGAAILKLETKEILNLKTIHEDIQRLQQINFKDGNAKLRIYIWRNTKGLYTPVDGKAHVLMTIEDLDILNESIIEIAGFSERIYNYPNPCSSFKTLSAMKYVLAGLEKQDKHVDEIILLDHRGFISEALSANIFWKTDNIYFTPPTSTGCIEGIMRNWVMDELTKKGFTVKEKLIEVNDLIRVDNIFTTNAMGIHHIRKIGNQIYAMDSIAQDIIKAIS